jgi:hypothetical protein
MFELLKKKGFEVQTLHHAEAILTKTTCTVLFPHSHERQHKSRELLKHHPEWSYHVVSSIN